MTRDEAAKELNVHARTVDRLIKEGELRAERFRNRVWIDPETVAAHKAARPEWVTA